MSLPVLLGVALTSTAPPGARAVDTATTATTAMAAPAEAEPAGGVEPIPWAYVQVELGLGQRSYESSDADGATVVRYEASAMVTPGLRFGLHPLRNQGHWLAPLAVDVSFLRAVPFESRRRAGGPERSTRHAEAAAVLRYAWPIPATRIVLVPEAGYHFSQFSLRDLGFGDPTRDVPNVAYHSLLAGLGIRVPVGERSTLRLAGAYLRVLDGGQVFSEGYHPDGTAQGFRVDAGVDVLIIPGLFAVVSGHLVGYALGFGDEGAAADAADRLTGLRLGLRWTL